MIPKFRVMQPKIDEFRLSDLADEETSVQPVPDASVDATADEDLASDEEPASDEEKAAEDEKTDEALTGSRSPKDKM